MDNIEEKFYMTFGLEKRCIRPKDCVRKGICRGAVACDFYTYPEITDRMLLELICMLNTVIEPDLGDINYARLRITILAQRVEAVTKVDWEDREPSKEEFIEEVRSLFEEWEE